MPLHNLIKHLGPPTTDPPTSIPPTTGPPTTDTPFPSTPPPITTTTQAPTTPPTTGTPTQRKQKLSFRNFVFEFIALSEHFMSCSHYHHCCSNDCNTFPDGNYANCTD